MIDQRQLLLIRAALQFFAEEMSPHEPAVAQAYCDKTLNPPLCDGEISELRDALRHHQLRYVICDLADELILHRHMFPTVTEAQSNCAGHASIATVLWPPMMISVEIDGDSWQK